MSAVQLFRDAGLERHIRSVINHADRAAGCAESPAQLVARFIEGASLEQCRMVALALARRLSLLETRHSGIKAANLEEAAGFAADAALDIQGALEAGDEAPCACGKCDGCVAARSDEDHQHTIDARMMTA
jgi:hypothetical protein